MYKPEWLPHTLICENFFHQQGLLKLTVHKPHDPTIPILLVFTKEKCKYVHTKIYIQIFITALFIKAKNWKQSNVYPGEKNKLIVICLYNGMLLSNKQTTDI